MGQHVITALCQYFLLNSKSVNDVDDELHRMLRCIIQEHLPIVHIWNYPHNFVVEYLSIRYDKLCSDVQLLFPNVISNIVCEYISDMSFTKINTPLIVCDENLKGNNFNDTSISLHNTTVIGAVFSNVSIDECIDTTLIKCVFINCSILITKNTIGKKCEFQSVTMGDITESKFRLCIFNRVSFRCMTISDTKFVGCTISKMAVANSFMKNIDVVGSNIFNMRIIGSTIADMNISFSYLNTILFGCNSLLVDVSMKRCNAKKIGACGTTIESCASYDSKLSSIVFLNCAFKLCILLCAISDLYTHNCTSIQCHFPYNTKKNDTIKTSETSSVSEVLYKS
jgi:uncharacterized protein YjbI with pentapeptide repeats